jgi:diguanylate cyclase (GGDEF)-like protein
VAERLRLAVAAATVPLAQGDAVHLTVSIGVAPFVTTDSQIADLLNRADTALYTAKNTGRNRVCCEVLAEATTLNKTMPKTTHAK